MAHILNDIEEFTIDELRAEIARRETALALGKCWYCTWDLTICTCKESPASRAARADWAQHEMAAFLAAHPRFDPERGDHGQEG